MFIMFLLFILICLATSLSAVIGFSKNIVFKNCPVFLYSTDFWTHFYYFISFHFFQCALFLFFWPIELNLLYLQLFLFSDNCSQSYIFSSWYSLGAYHTLLSFYLAVVVYNFTYDFLFNP